MSSRQENTNQSKGEEVLTACASCAGKTAHEVVVSLDQAGYDDESDIGWKRSYQIIRCKGCKIVSFREANENSDDFIQVGEEEWEHKVYEKLYPSRVAGRKDLGSDSAYLPADTRRIYDETVNALNNGSPVLAGIGLRALVETVCKEKKAAGNDLFQKITNLEASKILTPAGAVILHKIRTLGNAAAHEVKPHSDSQLALGMNIVEHMLKDVYILPKLASEAFD